MARVTTKKYVEPEMKALDPELAAMLIDENKRGPRTGRQMIDLYGTLKRFAYDTTANIYKFDPKKCGYRNDGSMRDSLRITAKKYRMLGRIHVICKGGYVYLVKEGRRRDDGSDNQ